MNLMMKKKRVEDLRYCEKVLINEREKLEKKLFRYRERIETDRYLTEKQFGKLLLKSDAITDEIESLTVGIRFVTEEIKMLQYQVRIESEENE